MEAAQLFHPAFTLEFFIAFMEGPTAGFAGAVDLPSESSETKDEAWDHKPLGKSELGFEAVLAGGVLVDEGVAGATGVVKL